MFPIRFAVLMFIFLFPFQLLFWHTDQFTDEALWEHRTAAFHEDLLANNLNALNPVYSGHPGVSFMSIGALAITFGVSPQEALRFGVSLLYAAASALILTLLRDIFRKPMLWITALGILAFHGSLSSASPTNAVIAPVAVTLFLLGWALYSHDPYKRSLPLYMLWGIVIGLAGITRVVSTTLLLLPLTLLLLSKGSWRYVVVSAVTAITTAFLFDPFLWHHPIQHIQHIISGSSINFTETVIDAPLHLRDFFIFAPTALLSFCIAGCLVFVRKLPKHILILLQIALTVSIIFAIPFLSVRAQSIRHFMPLIFLWDILLPLQIMWVTDSLPLPEKSFLRRFLPLFSAIGIVIYHSILLFFL